jgi:uncharacterized protein YjbJ (UPF0337 family)
MNMTILKGGLMCASARIESGIARNLCLRGGNMNEDQIQGRIEEVKGELKKVGGKFAGNKHLQQKGKAQKAHGKLEADFGDLKEKADKSV